MGRYLPVTVHLSFVPPNVSKGGKRPVAEDGRRVAAVVEILSRAEISRYLIEDAERPCHAQFYAAGTTARYALIAAVRNAALSRDPTRWIFRLTSSRRCGKVSSRCNGPSATARNRSFCSP